MFTWVIWSCKLRFVLVWVRWSLLLPTFRSKDFEQSFQARYYLVFNKIWSERATLCYLCEKVLNSSFEDLRTKLLKFEDPNENQERRGVGICVSWLVACYVSISWLWNHCCCGPCGLYPRLASLFVVTTKWDWSPTRSRLMAFPLVRLDCWSAWVWSLGAILIDGSSCYAVGSTRPISCCFLSLPWPLNQTRAQTG